MPGLIVPVAGQANDYQVAINGACNLPEYSQLPQFLPINCQLIDPIKLTEPVNTYTTWLFNLNLAAVDSVFSIPTPFIAISLLAVIAAVLQFVQVKMTSPRPNAEDPTSGMTTTMMYMFPAFTIIWGGIFPSGLILYWVVYTAYLVVQQYLIMGWGNLFPLFGWTPSWAASSDEAPRASPAARRDDRCAGDRTTPALEPQQLCSKPEAGPRQTTRQEAMTFREFTGKNVEEAIRSAMAEFSADLGDLDIEILSQGSRGVLGVGGEEARILAAPKSAVAAAETVRHEPSREQPREAAPAAEAPAVEAPAAEAPAAEAPTTDAGAVSDQPEAAAETDVEVEIVATTDADDQVAELARADATRRSRGGRGRGTRGRNGRERDHAIRERCRPREPRSDRPAREPSPFVPGKPVDELSAEERETLETAQTVLTEMIELMGLGATVEVAAGGDTARLNVTGR